MTSTNQAFYESLSSMGESFGEPLPVTLSPELIGLLSEQLYRSPSKAIEELVVNAFDAEADEARIFVAGPGSGARFIAVYDDGVGMNYEGLADLWKVGRPKVRDEGVLDRKQRKQIGKFGIGKLATYAVANRVTYVTKTDDQLLGVTIDYRDFTSNPDSTTTAVRLDVRSVDDTDALRSDGTFRTALESVGLDQADLADQSTWTIVILEDLKDKARTMGLGRLRWVLRTAMPLNPGFRLFLNGEEVESSKEDHEIMVEFKVGNLPTLRLDALKKRTGQEWTAKDGSLFAETFPSGISGEATVTLQTLRGKSADLIRSEGFFVYVRGRLVNEEDARFGLHELSHATLNRFRAEIHADDLDAVITANRESMEDSRIYHDAQAVLNEIFNEARQQYEDRAEDKERESFRTREDERDWVPIRLVEFPMADALVDYSKDLEGSEPDESWMYLNVDPSTELEDLTKSLYGMVGREQPYKYQYTSSGPADRLVRFDLGNSTFVLNENHDLVVAYANDPVAQRLLHDVVTGEALLEVYLREAGVRPHVIGEVLQRRDVLLRGLANSHTFSLDALSKYITESASNSLELEIAVVAGARALGFVTKHISGSGEPDGVARFTDFPGGEQKIILEAKSSSGSPSAKDIDFASIRDHMIRHGATGCLLVAPGYQGDDDGNAALSAKTQKISCWTVKQFATVVAAVESRQIGARQVLDIVRSSFAPQDVSNAVDDLLADPTWEPRALYVAIVKALREGHKILTNSPRNIKMIATQIAGMDGFGSVQEQEVQRAVSDIAGASQGALTLRENDDVILNVDYDELERRVQALTGEPGTPRRMGTFGEVIDQ